MTANGEKWYYTKDQLQNSPSRKCGYNADKELNYRQQAADLINDIGERLKLPQSIICTAIVYMHRFYVHHSLQKFHRYSISAVALFLAAKVENMPRKLEWTIKTLNACIGREIDYGSTRSEEYLKEENHILFCENVLLQTLGFEFTVIHPHVYVLQICQDIQANKELTRTSYFMAIESLHLTTMCLQYKPKVVACFCVYFASKWSSWEIPLSREEKTWYSYIDSSITLKLLEELTQEFLAIFDKSPSRLKHKVMDIMNGHSESKLKQHQHEQSLPSLPPLSSSALQPPLRSLFIPIEFSKPADSIQRQQSFDNVLKPVCLNSCNKSKLAPINDNIKSTDTRKKNIASHFNLESSIVKDNSLRTPIIVRIPEEKIKIESVKRKPVLNIKNRINRSQHYHVNDNNNCESIIDVENVSPQIKRIKYDQRFS
ncbi:cyclin-T2-like [Microplitis demolitor]|uniref:cyclin-T2-like n=1 Tax=Microplitis demolitor TaxID=69319 RepID=UPI00235B6286|nr:cyclin-T2-like [Microplitis demolitor]